MAAQSIPIQAAGRTPPHPNRRVTAAAASSSSGSAVSDGEPLRAIVVDDHPVVRAGVHVLLEQEGISVVADAGHLADALFALRRCAPDVLILDADLPDGDSIAALTRLRAEAPAHCRIVMLASQGEADSVRLALTHGADGYLLKSTPGAGLATAIRDVAAGTRFIDPTLRLRLLLDGPVTRPPDPLSPREREVLRLLAQGHTNQELATMLVISTRTAESHRRNIMQKLRLASRADMVAYALRAGMLQPAMPPPAFEG